MLRHYGARGGKYFVAHLVELMGWPVDAAQFADLGVDLRPVNLLAAGLGTRFALALRSSYGTM